jgi:Ca2+-transporting ATPase
MEQPPKNPKDKIVSNRDWRQIVFYAAALTIAVMAAVVYCQQFITTDSRVINNLAFSTLVFAQLLHVFNMSSSSSGFWINDITRNKYVWLALLICIGALVLVYLQPQLRAVLHLTVLSGRIWLVSILASLIPLGLVQAFTNIWKK